jgi:hypothetical protein
VNVIEISRRHRVSADEGQQRPVVQRRMAADGVVIGLELGELPLQVTGIPERHVVEKLPSHRPDQSLHEWVGQRDVRDGFDFVDI